MTLSSSPSISGFDIWVRFDPRVLSATTTSIDYTGNVLGSSAQVESECINNQPVVGSCGKLDGQGVVNLGLFFLGNKTTTVSGGLLYRITLTVLKVGFSQLHLLQVVLANGVKDESYTSSPVDGLFTNKTCGSSYCTPPVASFFFSPKQPSVGSIVTFNASASRPTNLGARVANYTWFWDEICGAVATTQSINTSIIQHTFCNAQIYSVTLTVNDTLGILWSVTEPVQVVYVFIDVTYGGIALDHQFGVLPGTVVHITAGILNNSTAPVNATLTITLDTGKPLGRGNFSLSERGGARGTIGSVPGTWDTTNYPPRVYRIDVRVNSDAHQNVTTDKSTSTFVQLVVPAPTGSLSLSLFQTTGIGIIVIIGLAAGLARFRKKPSWETEPL